MGQLDAVSVIVGFAFGILLVVLGAWRFFSPDKVWRSAQKRTAWEYRDPGQARRMQPSQRWLSVTRAKGVYSIVLGLAAIVFTGWLAGHLHKKAPDDRPIVTCDTFSGVPATPGATAAASLLPSLTICDTFTPRHSG